MENKNIKYLKFLYVGIFKKLIFRDYQDMNKHIMTDNFFLNHDVINLFLL